MEKGQTHIRCGWDMVEVSLNAMSCNLKSQHVYYIHPECDRCMCVAWDVGVGEGVC